MGYLKVDEQKEVLVKIRNYLDGKLGPIYFDPELIKGYYLWHYNLQDIPVELYEKIHCIEMLNIRIETGGWHSYFIKDILDEELPAPHSGYINSIDFDKNGEFKKPYTNEADKKYGEELKKSVAKYIEREHLIEKIQNALAGNKTEIKAALSDELWQIVEDYKKQQSNVKEAIEKITI